jgi:hypothetical protein
MKSWVTAAWLCAAFYFITRWGAVDLKPIEVIENGVVYLSLGYLTARYVNWVDRGSPNQFNIPQEKR